MSGTKARSPRRHECPADGDYEIRIRAWQDAFGDEPAKMTVRFDNKEIKTFDVPALREKPGIYTIRQAFTAGSHKIATPNINNGVANNNPDPKKRGHRNLLINR